VAQNKSTDVPSKGAISFSSARKCWAFIRRLQLQTIVYMGSSVGITTLLWELLKQKDQSFTPENWQFWVAIAVGIMPLVLGFVFNYLPNRLEKKREEKLQDESVGPAKGGPDYFRLEPYEAKDNEIFMRIDKAHETALAKFRNSDLPYFYITGTSGCGKSSVISAYLIPKLLSDTFVVELRGIGHPSDRLRKTLLREGNVWQQDAANEHSNDQLLQLIINAGKKLKADKKKLLLVYDQFEEALLTKSTPESDAFLDILREIASGKVANCTLLLSFRLDSVGSLTRAKFPPFDSSLHVTVEPFESDPARKFLLGGFEHIGDSLLDRIISEAIATDNVEPSMRPITLNMIGRMLRELLPGTRLKIGPRPFSDYVKRKILEADAHSFGAKVLQHLLDDSNKRQKKSVSDLSAIVKKNDDEVNAFLTKLSVESRGFVRCLNKHESEIGKREWEISHDFVAKLLGNIIPGLLPSKRRSIFQLLRPWLAGGYTAVALASLLFVVPYVLRREHDAIEAKLGREFGITLSKIEGTNNLRARLDPDKKLSSLNGAIPLMVQLDNINEINLSGCHELVELDEIHRIEGLQKIDASACRNLQHINFTKLAKLNTINLSDCDGLVTVNVQGLCHLQSLNLSHCIELAEAEIRGLQSLKQFIISFAFKLKELNVSDSVKLEGLFVNQCIGLSSLNVHGFDNLSHLIITNCPDIADLNLSGILNLRTLVLNGCERIRICGNFECSSLEKLEAMNCPSFNITDFSSLKSLRSLNLCKCAKLDKIILNNLSHLEILELRSIDQLSSINLSVLSKLRSLDIVGCGKLTIITASNLVNLQDCNLSMNIELVSLSFDGSQNIETLHLNYCQKLSNLDMANSANLKELNLTCCNSLENLDFNKCSNLEYLYLMMRSNLIDINLNNLSKLRIVDLSLCINLQSVSLESMASLQKINLSGCKSLTSLEINKCQSLAVLKVVNCIMLQKLNLKGLVSLGLLDISDCQNLVIDGQDLLPSLKVTRVQGGN
jgi:hypothetical protein